MLLKISREYQFFNAGTDILVFRYMVSIIVSLNITISCSCFAAFGLLKHIILKVIGEKYDRAVFTIFPPNQITHMRALLVLLLLATHFLSTAQISSKEIDAVANRAIEVFDVPGIAVAVVKDGKVVHSKGYGLASLNTGKKVDENTLFGIASNSKAFLTATIAMLIDEGKLGWDDKVTDYIPEFKLYDPYVTADFTIRDLLTHRSGMGLGAGDLMFFPAGSDFTLKDIIHNLRYLKQTSPFRSKFDYDNLLYLVAGEVVARVSGMSWEAFVEERIMKPLGMTRSAATLGRLRDKSNVIDGHAAFEGQKARVIPSHDMKIGEAAAGGIFSSVADLSKWMICRLDEGRYGKDGENRLFSEKNHIEMWKPHTNLGVRKDKYNTHFSSYALGWMVSDVKGYKQVTHTGGLEGMVTQVTLIPELNLGIVVLTNQQVGVAFISVTNTIKDAYLGLEVQDWVLKYDTLIARRNERNGQFEKEIWSDVDSAVAVNKGKMDMRSYTGKYSDPWLGEIEISDKGEQMWFQSKRSPKLGGEMFYYKGNTFVVKWKDRSMQADAYAMFTLDEQGKPNGLTMKAISPLTDFSYDFHDLDFARVKPD